MPDLLRSLDRALALTTSPGELQALSSLTFGQGHAFENVTSPAGYAVRRVDYLNYLQRKGKLETFARAYLEEVSDDDRGEVLALRSILRDGPGGRVVRSDQVGSPSAGSGGSGISIQLLIAQDKLERAIELLGVALAGDQQDLNTLTLLEARLSALRRARAENTITHEDASVESASIRAGLLSLVR